MSEFKGFRGPHIFFGLVQFVIYVWFDGTMLETLLFSRLFSVLISSMGNISNAGSRIPEPLLMLTSKCPLKVQVSQVLGTFFLIELLKTGCMDQEHPPQKCLTFYVLSEHIFEWNMCLRLITFEGTPPDWLFEWTNGLSLSEQMFEFTCWVNKTWLTCWVNKWYDNNVLSEQMFEFTCWVNNTWLTCFSEQMVWVNNVLSEHMFEFTCWVNTTWLICWVNKCLESTLRKSGSLARGLPVRDLC